MEHSFNNFSPNKTFDYSVWFRTNNTNCALSMLTFFFSSTESNPTAQSIPGASFVPSSTTFTVDFSSWAQDPFIQMNKGQVFYLAAESQNLGMHTKVLKLKFKKVPYDCWETPADVIMLNQT